MHLQGDIKEKKLSSQPRKNCQHAVSNPPRLIAITEQKSLELREEEEFNMMPPSPINDDIEHLLKEKLVHKKTSSPPTTPDTEDAKKGSSLLMTSPQIVTSAAGMMSSFLRDTYYRAHETLSSVFLSAAYHKSMAILMSICITLNSLSKIIHSIF